jgi:acetylornithine deacetylase
MDVSPLVERLRQAAAECGLEWEVRLESEPLFTPPDSPFVKDCLRLAGREKSHTVAYGTDGARFGKLKNKIVLGPGDIAQAHTHDEFIDLSQLELGTALYAKLIQEWCR